METRKIKLINKNFQYKFSFVLCLIGLTLFLIFVVPTYYLINSNYALFLETGLKVAPGIAENLEYEKNKIFYVFFTLFAVSSVSLFMIGIIMSHKITGPMFAFERAVNELMRGDFSRVMKLRKHDELHELEIIYDKLRKHFMEKETILLKTLREIQDAENRSAKLSELIEGIEDKIAKIQMKD